MNRSVRAGAAVLLAATAACGWQGSDASPAGGQSKTLTVYAASSLAAPFTELGEQLEAAHDGVSVVFNFAGSADLAAQIQQGAPADVFASADTANMDKVVSAGLVAGDPVNFASNTLQIAVPPDNPAGVATLQDLAKPGTQVVLCAPEVPCGAAAQQVQESAGVTITPVSEEQAVADVLAKVESGEADAGLVYVTDVRAAGDAVEGVAFPESSTAVNTYPIAVLEDTGSLHLSQQLVDLVTGDAGQAVLAAAGFGKPSAR
jgi:molybdate transport system substrate-binding protein